MWAMLWAEAGADQVVSSMNAVTTEATPKARAVSNFMTLAPWGRPVDGEDRILAGLSHSGANCLLEPGVWRLERSGGPLPSYGCGRPTRSPAMVNDETARLAALRTYRILDTD